MIQKAYKIYNKISLIKRKMLFRHR